MCSSGAGLKAGQGNSALFRFYLYQQILIKGNLKIQKDKELAKGQSRLRHTFIVSYDHTIEDSGSMGFISVSELKLGCLVHLHWLL